jgi:hypothetical protein
MHPIRQIIPSAPESIAIPENLRSRPVELIIRPLDKAEAQAAGATALAEDSRIQGRAHIPMDEHSASGLVQFLDGLVEQCDWDIKSKADIDQAFEEQRLSWD